MGSKTKRCHFIPKVYLRKWMSQNKSSKMNCLFCYDYLKGQFIKSDQGKIELGLNDGLFYKYKLYREEFEKEIGEKFENYYNKWLSSIEAFYSYVYEKGNSLTEELLNDHRFQELSLESFIACEWMLKFAFVQWIRYPDTYHRTVLFNLFRELMLKDDVEFVELFTGEYIKFPDDKKLIAFVDDCDKDIFSYAFSHIDTRKMNNLFGHLKDMKYVIFIDHSTTGKFVTSTYPVTPLFLTDQDDPYGFMLPLSPFFCFRIIKDGKFASSEVSSFPYQPCESTDLFSSEINMFQFLYNPNACIISGDKGLAKSVFVSMPASTVQRAHNEVNAKISRIYENSVKSIHYLDLSEDGFSV